MNGVHKTRGFTLLELVIVIVIIGFLTSIAAKRLMPFLDEAERIAVLRVEGQLRSSLVLEAARRIVRGQSASISELEGSNPIKLLLEPPKNYVGELRFDRGDEVPAGHWYFDQRSLQLVYRPGLPYGLRIREETPENPAFVVRVEFTDVDDNGTFDARRDELHGVRLVRVAGMLWLAGVM